MSINIEQVQVRVAKFYPQVERVDENVLCFYKQHGHGAPFAIYYLDVADNLPDTDEAVRQHIERVVGARYFEAEQNLQWNNYLYFIRDTKTLSNLKAQAAAVVIERNRTYARKFVIDELDLDELLQPSVVQSVDASNQVDVVSRCPRGGAWTTDRRGCRKSRS